MGPPPEHTLLRVSPLSLVIIAPKRVNGLSVPSGKGCLDPGPASLLPTLGYLPTRKGLRTVCGHPALSLTSQ